MLQFDSGQSQIWLFWSQIKLKPPQMIILFFFKCLHGLGAVFSHVLSLYKPIYDLVISENRQMCIMTSACRFLKL